MSLSRVIGFVPVKLLCPWLMRLRQVSYVVVFYHDVTDSTLNELGETYDKNVDFPTSSSPSSSIDTV